MNIKVERSEEIFFITFEKWDVPIEWQAELFNYLARGLPPGSFHRECFSNNLMAAVRASHNSNTWPAIRVMMLWMQDFAPAESWGHPDRVDKWLSLSNAERKDILIRMRLVLTDEDTVLYVLRAKNSLT